MRSMRAGTPAVVQVADWRHLLANFSDALRQALDRYHRRLREVARVCAAEGGCAPA